MPNVWADWDDTRHRDREEPALSREEQRELYRQVLQEENYPEDTPYESLPYYMTKRLESYGIMDNRFQHDEEEPLKNEGNSDMIDAYHGSPTEASDVRSVRHNVNLVNEYGEADDDGYNFDEPDMW